MGTSNSKPVVLTDEVNLNHFRLLRVVGKGAFGKVRIVERKDTGLTFALKYIRKDEVVRSESVRNIIRERRMLEHLNHPFLCNLRYSFQDIEYLYIVVDLMNGGDLRFHINRKTFTEEAVRFWVAELGCALNYIHKQGIVHRDVKPDNVLLDSEGHVHLADFNVASDLTPGRQLTSKSGTLAYLAPEVYRGRGYRSEVDWWSLGVTFYECIYNKRPFDAHHADQLAHAIVKGEPRFPFTSPAVSMPCLHAISSLLEKDITKRIGAIGFESFYDNPFFRELDFEALERKEVEPVFCPSSEKTNFDATYDLEELLLEEAPLEARARKQKPRAELREDATQQEIRADELHRMIETMFEPFNYTLLPPDRSPVATTPSPSETTTTITTTTTVMGQSPPAPARIEKCSPTEAGVPRSKPENIPTAPGPDLRVQIHSSGNTPEGSPPLLATALSAATTPPMQHEQYFPPIASTTSNPIDATPTIPEAKELQQPPASPTSASPPKSGPPHPPISKTHRFRSSIRGASVGGSLQVVFSPQQQQPPDSSPNSANPVAVVPSGPKHRSSPSTPAAASPSEPGPQSAPPQKPAGMLAFLSRKKGRDRSPKAKERGVIGKEGARVIISHSHGYG